MTRGLGGALQRELDSFYKQITSEEYTIREVTKGAFTQARAKLKASAFIELNELVSRDFYQMAPYRVWKNKRLVALDGSRLSLPSHPSIEKGFGLNVFGSNVDSEQSLALCSILYDPLNLICLDSQLLPYKCSELQASMLHLDKIPAESVVLADAYYCHLGLLFELRQRNIDFCVQAREKWTEVRDFIKSGKKEALVKLSLTKNQAEIVDKYKLDKKEALLTCKFVLDEQFGEKQVLCTSLIGPEHTTDDIIDLYKGRWGIEEAYKLLKARLNIEEFSGKTELAVRQDFHAKIFMMSLTAELCFPVEEKLRKEHRQTPAKRQKTINKTHALSKLKDVVIGLFDPVKTDKALESFDRIVYKTTEIVRVGRHNKRRFRLRKTKSVNYKKI